MKMFEQLKSEEHKEIKKVEVDNADFIKRNLMKSVDRSPQVYSMVERWLYSFRGGITKDAFLWQLKRLDWNDDVAIGQLEKAIGRRTIPLPPPPKKPILDMPVVEKIIEEPYVAISGKKFKSVIKQAVLDLKQCGTVYVLQVEELILQFKSYNDKGSSPQMIDKAIECDFLVIVDLEMPIHIEWHIHEALNRILRFRLKSTKPIVSTWNRFNDVNDFFEKFNIYSTE